MHAIALCPSRGEVSEEHDCALLQETPRGIYGLVCWELSASVWGGSMSSAS